jgi:hypothetical protein
MRTRWTALTLFTGATLGAAGWLLPRSAADRAVASTMAPAPRSTFTAATAPVVSAEPAPLLPITDMRLTAAEPEETPADPFQPPASTAEPGAKGMLSAAATRAPFIGPVLPARIGPHPAPLLPLRQEAVTASAASPVSPAPSGRGIRGSDQPDLRQPSPTHGPARPASGPTVSSRDDIQLKGIIRGKPDVALVRCGGQTYFVKAGERVAGTWEVCQIRDNSAVLRNGNRVLDLQIEGGSQ